MSLARKIDKYRTLKRIVAENRHLHARVVNNCLLNTFSQQKDYTINNLPAKIALSRSTILHTRPIGNSGRCFESAICFRVHERCHLVAAVKRGEVKEAAELGALTESLYVIPTSIEWRRIVKGFDSDLFVSFIRLLTCLNGTAAIEIARRLPPHSSNGGCTLSSCAGRNSQEFKATVSLELASIDEVGFPPVSQSDLFARVSVSQIDASAFDKNAHEETWQKMPPHYDFGVSGAWTFSVRDAIKLAIANSFSVLESCVIEEWRGIGNEAAVLLNEFRLMGSSTSEMDTNHLNNALVSHNFPFFATDGGRGGGGDLHVRWTVRSRQQVDGIPILSSREQNNSIELNKTSESSSSISVEIIGSPKAADIDAAEKMQAVAEYTTCTVPVSLSRWRSRTSLFVNGTGCKQIPHQVLWQQRCLPGAILMSMAVQRRALYRLDAFDSSEMQLYDLSQRLANGSHLSINDSGHSLSEVTWSFLSFFAALSCPTPLELSASTSEKCRVGEVSRHNARSPHTTVSLQNVWYCPDVVVMLAMVRSALCLSHNSFPEVRFEQKAVHDPARRVRELTVGLYGDVDIFTKVHIEWITPRGTFVASAESDPARHSTPCGGRGGSSQWLSCKDTGYPRGPLPLLVAAVCSLFDQVVDGCVAALQHYPTIPVQEPFSRKGLDFLFYSWFGATPQVRCFAIGTAAPMAEAKASADSKWLSAPDGFTSTDLGASMIRAMLFYDVLGQRVLFAETHASDVADAVARLEELAMKVNQINQDGCIPASAAGGRPFRSIARLQQWKGARERFERAVKSLETSAAPDKSSNVGPSVATMIPAASSPPWTYLLRRCIGSCTSEVSALWTVVEMLAMVLLTAPSLSTPPSTAALGSDVADRASADVLVVRFTPDGFLMEELAAVANSGCGEDELRWLGRRYVPWNCRPLGKETTPPPAGVVELLLKTPAPKFPETSHTQGRGSASEVSFRCRVDPLGSISGDEDRVLTGVLPALTVLCREALLYVYAEGKAAPKPILSQLPSVEDLLRWCAAADPVLARDADGFPPYEAQFYAAPKLLGELLQGVAGKYSCSYAVIQPRANRDDASIGNSYHGVGKDALSASASSTATPAQPSTVFYRSEALLVDLSEAEAADGDSRPWSTPRCDAAAQCAPPSVECTLFIDSIMGSGNHGKRHRVPFSPTADASNCSPDANSKPVIADAGYVLGRGVGRTKREAWRSAAWQALRLQFPHALAQLEVLRDVTELTQHPDQLNLLLAREDVANALVTVSTPQQELPQPAFPVCGLSWKWRAARSPHMHCAHSSNNPSVDAHHSGEWTQPVTFVCSVDLLHADNSRTPLPEAAAVAASAGEACVLAGKRLLQMAQGARHKKPVPASLPSSASSVSHTAWGIAAGGWGVGSGATRATATGTASSSEPNRQLYYANWRPTTHFTKSIWHAYAGALSLYFGEDMIVELLCDLRDEHGDIKDTKYPQLRTPARVFDHLSVLQVRARKEEVCPSGVEPAAASRVAGVSGDGDGEGPTKESAYHVGSGSIQSNGLLFRQTPASLMARLSQQRSPPPPPPPSSPPSAKPPRATSPSLPLRDKSQPFQILREISWWLSDLVQLCAMPLQTRKELRGLLLSRIRDAQRIQRATRWSPADRVKAMMLRWTGCHTEIRICRQNLISSSKTDSMWAAEVLIQICVLRQRTYSDCRTWRRSVAQGESHELGVMALAEEPGMWVAGRAVAATSDEAVWQLYCDVCEAMRHAAPENLLTEGIGAA